MNAEHIKVHIENALDLISMISDDVEENFIGARVDSAIKARATMTVSALAIHPHRERAGEAGPGRRQGDACRRAYRGVLYCGGGAAWRVKEHDL